MSMPKTAHVTERKETNIPIKALEGVKGWREAAREPEC